LGFGVSFFEHGHKICAFVFYVRALGDILRKAHERIGILLLGELNIERFSSPNICEISRPISWYFL
jgi:hypothetical protein